MRGSTNSKLKLSVRKEKAFELFTRGASIVDVARELQVHWDTAKRYQAAFEEELKQQALENPDLISDVITNTYRALAECEETRAEAWICYRKANTAQAKAAFLNLARQAGQDRAKLYGLLGVKPEYAAHVEKVRVQMSKLMEFCNSELCPVDRQRLIEFLAVQEVNSLQELPTAPEVEYSKP